MDSNIQEKIQELNNKITFWTTRQNKIKDPVEKAVLQDKIKEARDEIIKIQTTKKVSITNPVGTPVIMGKKKVNGGFKSSEGAGYGRVFL